MKIHVIGHASLLIEADDVTILMDPIFWDPHYEGTAVMCPAREVSPERLPPYSVIVVSHRHLDHFDIRTLASLDRQCTVLIPGGDALLKDAIHRLGFEHCRPLEDGAHVTFGRTTLTTTPSKAGVREFGVVVRDSSATIWNQVDTQITGGTAKRIADTHGPIDLLLATWQPLLEGEVLTNGTTSFPHTTYFKMLANVQLVRPRAVVPSACGFKYIGDGAWLNKFVFPATREMFARDVATLAPDVNVMIANPGDVFDVSAAAVVHHAGASPFVRTISDDVSDTWFDPVGAVPELVDANPRMHADGEMLRVITGFLTDAVLPMLEQSSQRERLAHEYHRLGIVYQLDVVFPSGPRSWHIDFGAAVTLVDGPSPTAHIRARIAASLLVDLIRGDTSASYVYSVGGYRCAQRVYAAAPHGMYKWQPTSEPAALDPLWMALDLEDLFKRYVDRDIAACGTAVREATESRVPEGAAGRPEVIMAGCVILLTGFSGAGKSTIARALVDMLTQEWSRPVTLLDGDHVRLSLSPELGFSREDRLLHLRRMAFVASEVARHGGMAICAAIAPFSEGREAMRRLVEPHGTFIVAHVATPLHVCEARDPKGLYARAHAGLLHQLTGVSDPYEAPENPELTIDASHVTVLDATQMIVRRLLALGCLLPHRISQVTAATDV